MPSLQSGKGRAAGEQAWVLQSGNGSAALIVGQRVLLLDPGRPGRSRLRDRTRVSLQLPQGFSIGSAAVGRDLLRALLGLLQRLRDCHCEHLSGFLRSRQRIRRQMERIERHRQSAPCKRSERREKGELVHRGHAAKGRAKYQLVHRGDAARRQRGSTS